MPITQSNLKSYMNEVEKVVEVVEPAPIILHTEPVIEKRASPVGEVPEPIVEKRPRVKPTVTRQPRVVEPLQEDAHPITEARDVFYQHLLERLEKLDSAKDARPISIVVETTESHIERLVKIEHAMLDLTNECVASVKQRLEEEVVASREMLNNLVVNRDMIDVIVNSQQKIVESQKAMITAISGLSAKIAAISTNQPAAPVVNVPAPVINIPAPIVNISENGRRTTKMIERDKNGNITKVIEDSSSDE